MDMIYNIGRVNKGVEKIISNGLQIMVGNGEQTCLCEDPWIGNQCLKDRFPRLYTVSSEK